MVQDILHMLKTERGLELSGALAGFSEVRVRKRMSATGHEKIREYYHFLKDNPDELDALLDELTVNVGRFFRNSISYDYLAKYILPQLIERKFQAPNKELRIWSAGCSGGEEPYSVAIILHRYLEETGRDLPLSIFATDVNRHVLKRAVSGIYGEESLNETKLGIVNRYFTQEGNRFILSDTIRKMVRFHYHDLTDSHSYAPRESIFGEFDLILCRNVLIYFAYEMRVTVLSRFLKAMKTGGNLMLGEAESPGREYRDRLYCENDHCRVYKKQGY